MSSRFSSKLCCTIRHRRRELNLTQREVGESLGVTPDFITLVELGHRRLDLDRIPALADALKLDRAQLCRGALEERAPELYAELFPQEKR